MTFHPKLVFDRSPYPVPWRKGKRWQLQANLVPVGSSAKALLHIPDPGVEPEHALLVRAQGQYRLQDLAGRGNTRVDGQPLSASESVLLGDGREVRFGDTVFYFYDENSRRPPPERTLAAWWNGTPPAGNRPLTDQELDEMAPLCGTSAGRKGLLSRSRVQAWYAAYCGYNGGQPPPLPLAIPLLVDLGSIVVFDPPPLRSLRPAHGEDACLAVLYDRFYVQRFLRPVSFLEGVRVLRDRLSAVRHRQREAEIVADFIASVAGRIKDLWLAFDGRGGAEPGAMPAAAPVRLLTESPNAADHPVQGYLIQMGRVLSQAASYGTLLDPVRQFVLAAWTQLPDKEFDARLIEGCLQSKPLDERQFQPERIDTAPLRPEVPSPHPGDEGAIRRVRKTNELARLPQVIPQELALLGRPRGKRHLLHKLMHEGLLCWDRHDYDAVIRRDRYLVCLIADVRIVARVGHDDLERIASGDVTLVDRQQDVTASHAHAKRLIFEILRDLATFFHLPGVSLETRVFLEAAGDTVGRRLSLCLDRHELQSRFGKGKYDDMLELERRAPGYFFPLSTRPGPARGGHARFIRDVFDADEFDFTLFVFLGPKADVRQLIPVDPPPARKRRGTKDVVTMVPVGRWPRAVEAVTCRDFHEALQAVDYRCLSDEELRYHLLEQVLGTSKSSAESELVLDF